MRLPLVVGLLGGCRRAWCRARTGSACAGRTCAFSGPECGGDMNDSMELAAIRINQRPESIDEPRIRCRQPIETPKGPRNQISRLDQTTRPRVCEYRHIGKVRQLPNSSRRIPPECRPILHAALDDGFVMNCKSKLMRCAGRAAAPSEHLVETMQDLLIGPFNSIPVARIDNRAENGARVNRVLAGISRERGVGRIENPHPRGEVHIPPRARPPLARVSVRRLDLTRMELVQERIEPRRQVLRDDVVKLALDVPRVPFVHGDAGDHRDGAASMGSRLVKKQEVQRAPSDIKKAARSPTHRNAVCWRTDRQAVHLAAVEVYMGITGCQQLYLVDPTRS